MGMPPEMLPLRRVQLGLTHARRHRTVGAEGAVAERAGVQPELSADTSIIGDDYGRAEVDERCGRGRIFRQPALAVALGPRGGGRDRSGARIAGAIRLAAAR